MIIINIYIALFLEIIQSVELILRFSEVFVAPSLLSIATRAARVKCAGIMCLHVL